MFKTTVTPEERLTSTVEGNNIGEITEGGDTTTGQSGFTNSIINTTILPPLPTMEKDTVSTSDVKHVPLTTMADDDIESSTGSKKSRSGSTASANNSAKQKQEEIEKMFSAPTPKSFQEKLKLTRKKVNYYMNTAAVQVFLGVLLMLSLFMADAWVLANTPDSYNDTLNGILVFVFIIFALESIILMLVQDGYTFSFFFWMDLLGTLSILLDISFISDTILGGGEIQAEGSVLRATKAAKLGARYGRLMRILKLLKFMKEIPCMQYFAGSDDDYEPTMSSIKKVSEDLSELLSLRVAALVMLLVIVMPFLNYSVTDFSPNAWLNNMRITAKNETVTAYDINYQIFKVNKFYQEKDSQLRSVIIETPWVQPHNFNSTFQTSVPLRESNLIEYRSYFHVPVSQLVNNPIAMKFVPATYDATTEVAFKVFLTIDDQFKNAQDALFGIIIIIMVIVILFTFTGSFNGAVNRLVVKPLEKMLRTLRNSAMVMLTSLGHIKDAQEDTEVKESNNDDSDDEDDDMETAMLESMVEKLASIVKHVLPGNQEIVEDENVDSGTATWLNASYSQGQNKKREAATIANVNVPGESEKARIQALDDAHTIVTRETLDSWNFSVLDHNIQELNSIITYQFSLLNLLDEFNVPMANWNKFLKEMSEKYINTNTYHNYQHGCDVCHTTYRLLMVTHLHTQLSKLEVFSLLVGALAHDVGHIGVNNLYLVKSKHQLALTHNDRSPLENMHCVALYTMLQDQTMNIFKGLTDEQWRESRKVILTVILGTDMSHHFEQINKTQLFKDLHGEDTKGFYRGGVGKGQLEMECMREEKNRLFIMELVLHCSDVSNPYKPFHICRAWADLVVEEFCRQGDREKEEGLEISPMCDRSAVSLCNMQLGFIEFVVAPLINAFITIFPPLVEIGDAMAANVDGWCELRKKELAEDAEKAVLENNTAEKEKAEAECQKLTDRNQKFKEKMEFMTELREVMTDSSKVGRRSLN